MNAGSKRRARRFYANVLVDTVRRHSLLPSQALEKIARFKRDSALKEVSIGIGRNAVLSSMPLTIMTNSWIISTFLLLMAVAAAYTLLTNVNWAGNLNILTSMMHLGGQPLVTKPGENAVFQLQAAAPTAPSIAPQQPAGFGLVAQHQSGLSICGRRPPPLLERDTDGMRMRLVYPREHAPPAAYGLFIVRGGNGSGFSQMLTENVGWGLPSPLFQSVPAQSMAESIKNYSLHTPWPSYFAPFGTFALLGVMCLVLFVLKLTNNTQYAHKVSCLTLSLLALCKIINTYALINKETETMPIAPIESFLASPWVNPTFAGFYVLVAIAFFVSPRYPDMWTALWSASSMTLLLFYNGIDTREKDAPTIELAGLSYQRGVLIRFAPTILFGLLFFIIRVKVIMTSKFKVYKQIPVFEQVWKDFISNDGSLTLVRTAYSDELERLERVVGEISSAIPAGTIARQFNLRADATRLRSVPRRKKRMDTNVYRPSSSSRPSSGGSGDSAAYVQAKLAASLFGSKEFDPTLLQKKAVPNERLIRKWGFESVMSAAFLTECFVHDAMRPITSLDQLWTQAMLLRGFIMPKMVSLARRFNGSFPVRDSTSMFERPNEDCMWFPFKGRIKVCDIKNIDRGIEKVDTCYGGDVSRLLDVCRGRIVFDTVEDMANCLEALASDLDVSIVRIKSSMTKAGQNPAVWTGLRFISVNLRIQNYDTHRLAISAHICEVQFMLRCMAERVTPDKQREYIGYRDSRSAFDFTVIPGSNVRFESMKLASALRFYLTDLIWGTQQQRPGTVQPWRDIQRPRGILKRPSAAIGTFEIASPATDLSDVTDALSLLSPLNTHKKLARGGPVRAFSPASVADTVDASHCRMMDSFGRSAPASSDVVDAVGHVTGPEESNVSISVQGRGFGEASGEDGDDHARNGHSDSSAPMPDPATLEHQDDENVARNIVEDDTAECKGGYEVALRVGNASGAVGGLPCEISLAEEGTVRRDVGLKRDGQSRQPYPERPVSSHANSSPTAWSVEGGHEKRVSFVPPEAIAQLEAETSLWETDYGVKLTHEDVTKLECVCKMASLGFACGLDSISSDFDSSGLGKASLTSVIFVADESTIAASRFTQIFCIIGGICVMWVLGQTPEREGAGMGISASKPSFTHFRYTSLADRDGRRGAQHPGVAEFGVLHAKEGDCSLRDAANGIFDNVGGKYDGIPRVVTAQGPEITIAFSDPVPFHGWFLKTPKGGADTSNFEVKAKRGDEGEWKVVGRPSWRAWSSDLGSPDFDGSTSLFSMPNDGEVTLLFEPTVAHWLLSLPHSCFGFGVGLFLFGLIGFLRFHRWAIAGMFFGCAIAVFLSMFHTRLVYDAFLPTGKASSIASCEIGRSLLLFVASCISLLRQGGPGYIKGILVQIACIFSVLEVYYAAFAPFPVGPNFVNINVSIGFCAVIWGLQAMALGGRVINRKWAIKIIKGDKSRFDMMWREQLKSEDERAAAKHLSDLISSISMHLTDKLHQCNRRSVHRPKSTSQDQVMTALDSRWRSTKNLVMKRFQQKDLGWLKIFSKDDSRTLQSDFESHDVRGDATIRFDEALTRDNAETLSERLGDVGEDVMLTLMGCRTFPRSIDRKSKVVSYDQLYVQAVLLNDILQAKIKNWAVGCSGYLPLSFVGPEEELWETVQFMKWSETYEHPEIQEKFLWPGLKKCTRGFEKLARVYGGDVSKMLDITRFSLCFDCVADITKALNIIMADEEVKVVRVRNRLKTDSRNAEQYAGYRAVLVNLRVVSDMTDMLGCEAHICEVQLVTRVIAEMSTIASHSRYVKFRDLRAE